MVVSEITLMVSLLFHRSSAVNKLLPFLRHIHLPWFLTPLALFQREEIRKQTRLTSTSVQPQTAK